MGRIVRRFVGTFVVPTDLVGAIEGTTAVNDFDFAGHPMLLHITPSGQHMLLESSVSQKLHVSAIVQIEAPQVLKIALEQVLIHKCPKGQHTGSGTPLGQLSEQ